MSPKQLLGAVLAVGYILYCLQTGRQKQIPIFIIAIIVLVALQIIF